MQACGRILVARAAASIIFTQAMLVFRPASLQCTKLSFMAFWKAPHKTRCRTASLSLTAIFPRKMVALVRMEASASFCRATMARTSLSCSCGPSSLSTTYMRLIRVDSRNLALESEKPASTWSKMLLFTTESGISAPSGLSEPSMHVRTVRSVSDHSCTMQGTQVCLKTPSSSLPMAARRHSRLTDTCTDCLQPSLASRTEKSLMAICRARERLGRILCAQTARDRPASLGSSLLTTSRNSLGCLRDSSPRLSMNCRCSELNMAHWQSLLAEGRFL
mmetsp:Transcript_10523/g.23365  ORF Transcript_10523/g.23365 Transcript_10523/m.23365 type:complete len:276 (-) Transcript_10523:862-1689(-)